MSWSQQQQSYERIRIFIITKLNQCISQFKNNKDEDDGRATTTFMQNWNFDVILPTDWTVKTAQTRIYRNTRYLSISSRSSNLPENPPISSQRLHEIHIFFRSKSDRLFTTSSVWPLIPKIRFTFCRFPGLFDFYSTNLWCVYSHNISVSYLYVDDVIAPSTALILLFHVRSTWNI